MAIKDNRYRIVYKPEETNEMIWDDVYAPTKEEARTIADNLMKHKRATLISFYIV